jgi:hypothetical protein
MTLRTSAPRKGPRWAILLITIGFALTLFGGTTIAAPGTEGSVVDYSQCANGKPGTSAPTSDCDGWIFGILNANNSQYGEDQVTAQRLILSLPAGGSINDRTIKLKWLVRKATTHAYDSLATWDHTQSTADPCQNLNGPVRTRCLADIATPATLTIGPDAAEVSPNTGVGAPSTATSFHQLAAQQLEMYGLGAGGDIDSMVYGGLVDEDGDLYQTATITYDVASLTGARQVMLLFGGHLAAGGGPRSWGAGNGASDINGGPYHIKLIAVDGASIGNRDNQIMSSAILPLTVTLGTTLHQTDVNGADITPTANNGTTITVDLPANGSGVYVKDFATASDSGATGTVAFRYYTSLTACQADTTGTGGTAAGGGALANGVAGSSVVQFTSVATYWWRAFLTGSDITQNTASPCDEVLTLRQSTSAATTLHERTTSAGTTDVSGPNNGKNITVIVGAWVNDTLQITPSGATGTVTFKTYATLANCGADLSGTTRGSGLALTANSDTVQFNAAGTTYWRAFFTGTNGFLDSSSPCVTGDNESVTVNTVATSLNTSPSVYPNDSATVSASAGGNVAGSVLFKMYSSETTCLANGTADFSETVNLPGTQTSSTVGTHNGDPGDTVTDASVAADATVWWRVSFTSTNAAQVGRNSLCLESTAIDHTANSSGGTAP